MTQIIILVREGLQERESVVLVGGRFPDQADY